MAELRIKELCKQQGITQQELAQKLGIAQSTLSQRMSTNPTLSSLEEIAQALGVSVRDLFKPEGNEAKLTCPHCGMPIEICIK